MNQPSHYMPAIERPGFTRCLFRANYRLTSDLASSDEPADSLPIVLCIDRQAAKLKAAANKGAVPDTVTDTLQSAIALAEQDPLLQCVSNWLRQDLDWHPMQLNTPVSVDLTLSSVESAGHKIGLAFGHAAQSLPSFPAQLRDIVNIQEHKKSVLLCLAQLQLSGEDKLRLQPGSCIVLPDTFKAGCTVSFCDRLSGASLAQAYLDRAQSQLSRMKNVATAELHCLTRIILRQPVTVDMYEWFSGTENNPVSVELAPLVGQMVAVQVQGVDGIEEYNAQLVEVGSGLAALLESTD